MSNVSYFQLDELGLPLWQTRQALPGAKAGVKFSSYNLYRENGDVVGALLLEELGGDNAHAVNELLNAMLRAVQLKVVPVYLTRTNFLPRMLIMGHELAEKLSLSDIDKNKVIVTYHPQQLIIDPQLKRPAWQDLQLMVKQWKLTSE